MSLRLKERVEALVESKLAPLFEDRDVNFRIEEVERGPKGHASIYLTEASTGSSVLLEWAMLQNGNAGVKMLMGVDTSLGRHIAEACKKSEEEVADFTDEMTDEMTDALDGTDGQNNTDVFDGVNNITESRRNRNRRHYEEVDMEEEEDDDDSDMNEEEDDSESKPSKQESGKRKKKESDDDSETEKEEEDDSEELKAEAKAAKKEAVKAKEEAEELKKENEELTESLKKETLARRRFESRVDALEDKLLSLTEDAKAQRAKTIEEALKK